MILSTSGSSGSLKLMSLISCPASGAGGREAEVALERIQGRTALDRPADKGIRHEVDAGERRIGRLDGEWCRDLLRRERQDVVDRPILAQNLREARRRALAGGDIWDAEIVARPADRVEDRLIRRQEAVAIGPAMVVRRAVIVLARELQRIGSIARGPRAALVGAVLAHQQPALQDMVLGREADGVAVAIAP